MDFFSMPRSQPSPAGTPSSPRHGHAKGVRVATLGLSDGKSATRTASEGLTQCEVRQPNVPVQGPTKGQKGVAQRQRDPTSGIGTVRRFEVPLLPEHGFAVIVGSLFRSRSLRPVIPDSSQKIHNLLAHRCRKIHPTTLKIILNTKYNTYGS